MRIFNDIAPETLPFFNRHFPLRLRPVSRSCHLLRILLSPDGRKRGAPMLLHGHVYAGGVTATACNDCLRANRVRVGRLFLHRTTLTAPTCTGR